MPVQNKVQLITYPDSLGGDLRTLKAVLDAYFPGAFKGGIHILPPFPSSGDRGFAPLTYLEIEPAFGTWAELRAIGEDYDILLDLMINHISRQSSFFQDFLKKGRSSEYADLFLTLDKLWAGGEPVEEDIARIFLRRKKPYSSFPIEATGAVERVWTTFGKQDPSEQIDMDIGSTSFKSLLVRFFENFRANNVKIVRLDAVGYVVKKMGTSCFFVEPEIYEFLDQVKALADRLGIELLPELHAHNATQRKLSERGYWIYDFILPYTILAALLTRDSAKLKEYLRTRPSRQFTMLDCHDGIPVKPDLDDLATSADARKVVDECVGRGASLSLIVSDEHKAPDGFDVHQIRCSYYSALGCDDDAYLAARAIQFFAPGIPQVYYVGLLAGENDQEAVRRTGEGREINRHNFTLAEIDQAVQREVVKRLLRLIRFRNEHGAFDGEFQVQDSAADELRLSWRKGEKRCALIVDLNSMKAIIEYSDEKNGTARFVA